MAFTTAYSCAHSVAKKLIVTHAKSQKHQSCSTCIRSVTSVRLPFHRHAPWNRRMCSGWLSLSTCVQSPSIAASFRQRPDASMVLEPDNDAPSDETKRSQPCAIHSVLLDRSHYLFRGGDTLQDTYLDGR